MEIKMVFFNSFLNLELQIFNWIKSNYEYMYTSIIYNVTFNVKLLELDNIVLTRISHYVPRIDLIIILWFIVTRNFNISLYAKNIKYIIITAYLLWLNFKEEFNINLVKFVILKKCSNNNILIFRMTLFNLIYFIADTKKKFYMYKIR